MVLGVVGSSPIIYPRKNPALAGFFICDDIFMYWVYVLFSDNFNRFYIGQTSNLSERLRRHNGGWEKSTSRFGPWRMVCKIRKDSRSEAMVLERKLKNLNTEDLNKFIAKYSSAD